MPTSTIENTPESLAIAVACLSPSDRAQFYVALKNIATTIDVLGTDDHSTDDIGNSHSEGLLQEPFWVKDANGHLWQLNNNGEPDIITFGEADHWGPVCIVCGYYFCEHCEVRVPDSCYAVLLGMQLTKTPD